MFKHQVRVQRRHRCNPAPLLTGLAAALGILLVAEQAVAGPPAYRIEEDWEVIVGTPESNLTAPQIVTAMSSTQQLADVHAVFELNHRSLPSFNAGSMQLQVWSGELLLGYRDGWDESGVLNTAGETIRYTQVMKLYSGKVEFDVTSGSSTTWGSFGTSGSFKTALPTQQINLSNYSPDTSVANSYVGFAKHCVQKLALKEVRWYDGFGNLIQKDTTERVVHQLSN